MRDKETDIDEEIDFSEEAFKKRFRRVSRDELPAGVRKLFGRVSREVKSRITIYLDADIVIKFREIAERENVGYQTLINKALRAIVDGMAEETAKKEIKEDILKDRKFLRQLKSALSS